MRLSEKQRNEPPVKLTRAEKREIQAIIRKYKGDGKAHAGILISCLGAVMDVSVSITAALEEIRAKAPTLSLRELVRSGLTVGHDMIGTMSNTLILAYTGTATGTLLTLYAYEMPYIQMMSYNAIVIEILSGLCGTIGVVLTVPIQTLITAFVITRKK